MSTEPISPLDSAPAAIPNSPVASPAQPGKARRKWLRRALVLVLVAAALFLLRGPLLTGLAGLLIADQPRAGDWIAPIEGHGQYAQIAQYCREHRGARVLLLRLDLSRLEALGASPRGEEIAMRELDRQGVPAESVLVVRGPGRGVCDWNKVRCLGQWLAENPDAQLTLVCNRFASRRKRMVLDRLLPSQDTARVRLWAVAHPWYDETNWWRHKQGVLDLFNGLLDVSYTWMCGDTSARWQSWNADDYERTLETAP